MTNPQGRTVRYQPVLPLRTALGWGRPRASAVARPFPLDQARVVPTYSGTVAIYQAFRALRLPAGSVVLCPSYNCGHEIEPLLRLGLKVQCYRIRSDLTLDLEDLERRMDSSVRAVLVTHYFGFPQRLDEVRVACDRKEVFLIEDCAHAFLSDDPAGRVGRVGDAAVYSMRKSLSLPNGGVVLFNHPALSPPDDMKAPPALSTWLKTVDLTKKSVLDRASREPTWQSWMPLLALAPVVAGGEVLRRLSSNSTASYDPDDEDFGFASSIMSWRASAFSLGLLDSIDWRDVADRRRANYRVLADALHGLSGCRLLWPQIPDGTVPLFLPVRVERRRELFRFLVWNRIHAAVWWDQKHPAVDWDEFPEAAALKGDVLALPVHQDLDKEQLDYLITTIRRYPF